MRRVPLLAGWPGGAQISAPRSDFPTEEEGKRRVGDGKSGEGEGKRGWIWGGRKERNRGDGERRVPGGKEDDMKRGKKGGRNRLLRGRKTQKIT